MRLTISPKELTDAELELCLREMRNRGWACAVYNADAVSELIIRGDVNKAEIADWLKQNHAELEQALCQGMYDAVEEQWPAEEGERSCR